MIALITSNPPVQGYATHKLYSVLAAKSNQPVLLQLGVWCIGEYGELLVGSAPPEGTEGETPDQVAVVKLLEGVLRSPVATTVTKEYTLNALMKLTTRFSGPAVQLLQQQLASYNTSMSLELQQRSVEYSALLRLDAIRSGVLERMPAFEKKEKAPPTDDGMGMGSMGGGGGGGDLVGGIATPSAPVAVASAPAPAASEMDLLSDILGAGPTPTPAAAPMGMPGAAAAPPPGAGGMDMSLMDLLGGGPAAPAATPPAGGGMGGGMDVMGMMGSPMGGAPPPAAPAAAGGVPPFVAYNKNGLAINFAPSKDPANPSVTQVEATFTNSSPMPIAGLNFQVAVPKYMKLQMTPASGNAVPPNGSGTVTQLFKVANSMQGQKPVVLKIKIDFTLNGQPVSDMGTVDQFPPTY